MRSLFIRSVLTLSCIVVPNYVCVCVYTGICAPCMHTSIHWNYIHNVWCSHFLLIYCWKGHAV